MKPSHPERHNLLPPPLHHSQEASQDEAIFHPEHACDTPAYPPLPDLGEEDACECSFCCQGGK